MAFVSSCVSLCRPTRHSPDQILLSKGESVYAYCKAIQREQVSDVVRRGSLFRKPAVVEAKRPQQNGFPRQFTAVRASCSKSRGDVDVEALSRRSILRHSLAIAGLSFAAACAPGDVHAAGGLPDAVEEPVVSIPDSKFTTTSSGLKYADITVGNGPEPVVGDTVVINYVGRLPNGRTFLSTVADGKPAQYRFGVGDVLKGLDEGVSTMRVGGKRRLVVPPELGYGNRIIPASPGKPSVPANSTLEFDVTLVYIPGKYDDE